MERNEIAYVKHEIVLKTPTLEEFQKMLGYYQGRIRKLFNTSGLLYRELGLSEKIPEMSKDQAIKLLMQHGMLVKRPFCIGPDFGLLGFREAEWAEKIL